MNQNCGIVLECQWRCNNLVEQSAAVVYLDKSDIIRRKTTAKSVTKLALLPTFDGNDTWENVKTGNPALVELTAKLQIKIKNN